jgi:hypothetical protein
LPLDTGTLIVSQDQLGQLGRQLGRGGQATVFALPHFTLPDTAGELAFKRYHAPPSSAADLRKIVSLRGGLDPAARQQLDTIASWPCRIVQRADGTVTGVVLPLIPSSYVDDLVLPSGKTKTALREVLNLFVPEDRVRNVGRPVPTSVERLAVCRDFAAGLQFLHERLDVVFGDINARNELWQLKARPMVMFLDCDAVRPRDSVAATKQLNAPDWEPPERTQLNRTTDLYKLGLFILRALTPGLQSSARRDPAAAAGVLDALGLDLLTRALGTAPAARPSAREWTVHLSRLLGDPVDPPKLAAATLDRHVVVAGHEVEIQWRATDTVWIDVSVAGAVQRVDGRAGAGTVRVAPERTGPVVVRAGNNHGETELALGTVTVAPMPVLRALDVPMPRLDLGTLTLPSAPPLPAMPLFPVVTPSPLAPDLVGLLGAGPDRHRPPEFPRLLATRFPMDVVGMVTGRPDIDFELPLELPSRFER